jgi:hypothetical protein
LVTSGNELPYHFFSGKTEAVAVKSATDGGKVRLKRNNGINSGGSPWHPPAMTDSDHFLKTDFLLLTVLPWNKAGGMAVFVCGGHGPGVRAVEFLLDSKAFPTPELEKLVADLEDAPGFQIVFEVGVHQDDSHSMPSGIKVSKQLPPTKLRSIASLLPESDEQILRAVRRVVW